MDIHKAIQSAFENHRKGNFRQAEDLYKKILEKQPENPDILHMLGLLLCQSADYDAAVHHIRKALQFGPADVAGAYCHLGIALHGNGLLDEAITSYEKALQFNPSFAEAYCNLGYVLQERGLIDEAIPYYQRALQCNASLVEAHGNLGYALIKKGLLDESIRLSRKAIELNPYYATAYCNLGLALKGKGQFDEAILWYQKAIELNPNFAQAYCNLGTVLQEKGRCGEAYACYQKAIELNPRFAAVHNNIGLLLQGQGRFHEAISSYQKAIDLKQDFADAHWNKAFALLLTGNYREGWKEYEWRWKTKDFVPHYREFRKPLWSGGDIKGRTLLLHAEQGLGDTIQFVRYIPLVAHYGAKVIFECYRELQSLLENIQGICQVIVKGERIPDFDIHCPLLSLPLVFDTTIETIPLKIPYIPIDPVYVQKWRNKVHQRSSVVKIGLVWSGNPKYGKDQYRSLPPGVFSSLANMDEVLFYSLQKGVAGAQVEELAREIKIIDCTEDIHNFSDTAGLIEHLDLIISVDTAVAHLAGAMGKPVWTLLPFSPDWRWMLDREDSPWYPTMRLFRQPAPGDWGSVMERVAAELKRFIKEYKTGKREIATGLYPSQ
jgi:tetratricopeptide (TPR) repeat protein